MSIKQEIQKTYNKIAKDYDREFQDVYFSDELNIFLNELPKKPKMLDLGCGVGNVAAYLEKKGLVVLGIDFSRKMLEMARKRCKKSKFILTDVETFAYGKNKWDGIIATYILLHLKDSGIKKLLKKFHTSLKSGGLIFVSMIEGRGEYFGPEPLDKRLKMYFNYTSKSKLEKLLTEAGFKIVLSKTKLRKTESMKYKGLFIVAKKNSSALNVPK